MVVGLVQSAAVLWLVQSLPKVTIDSWKFAPTNPSSGPKILDCGLSLFRRRKLLLEVQEIRFIARHDLHDFDEYFSCPAVQ